MLPCSSERKIWTFHGVSNSIPTPIAVANIVKKDTAWERAGVSELGKKTLWRTEWPRYSLLAEKLWDIGRQLPGHYGDEDPSSMKFETREHLQQAAWDRFLQMDLFFVKVRRPRVNEACRCANLEFSGL